MNLPRLRRPSLVARALAAVAVVTLVALAPRTALAEEPTPAGAAAPSPAPPPTGGTFPAPRSFQDAIDLTALRLLAVQVDARRKPLDTWARERVRRITGRVSVDGEDPVFTVLSMLFEADAWRTREAIHIDNARIAEAVTGKPGRRVVVTLADLETASDLHALFRDANARKAQGKKAESIDALAVETIGRLTYFRRLAIDLRVIPAPRAPGAFGMDGRPGLAEVDDDGDGHADIRDESPGDQSPGEIDYDECFAPDSDDRWSTPGAAGEVGADAARLGDLVGEAFLARDAEAFDRWAAGFVGAVRAAGAADAYPDEADLRLELGFNVYRPFTWAGRVLFGALLLLLVGVAGGWGGVRWSGVGLLGLGIVLQLWSLVVRSYLHGHAPVGSLYEATAFGVTMLGILALIFEAFYRNGWFPLAAALAGAVITQLAEAFPIGREIHPLQPVLRSYWLNIHVTCMLTAYAALTLAFAIALGWFVRRASGAPRATLDRIELLNYRSIQAGYMFLATGIGLGAIWANQSWGRYWDWDPKETWAFITLTTYTVFLHCRFMGWARGAFAALWNVFGFAAILFTYLGVSYLLESEHSYLADGDNRLGTWVWVGAGVYTLGAASLVWFGMQSTRRGPKPAEDTLEPAGAA